MPNPVSDLSNVRRPISQANGLPNAHYTDPAVFNEERQAVLFDSWAGLGVGADVPEIGDAVPVTFLNMPLLIVRDKQGQVRVFQNICRHRGMILVDAPRKIEGAIRCPYHSWCYSTDGRLVSTPHVGGPGQNTHEGIDRDLLGLIEVRSHIWMDVIYINISGTAAPFEEAHADLLARWAEFDKPLFHGGQDSRFTLEVNCNWKLAVENYCESYHLPWVHPGLNTYSRLEDHYHIEEPGKFSGQGTWVYRQLKDEDGTVFPDFDALESKWDTAAEYITVYPNVLLGVHRDHTFAIILVPQGPDRTVENIHLYYAAEHTPDALRQRNTEQWKEVFVEDVFVVEGMQRGRHATGFDGGRFSPVMDGPTHMFHDWVAAQMERHRTDAPPPQPAHAAE
ncbi:aromatic ring-hydroxylating dioxygenase subunit alpha [Sulfitobacter sp. M57]|uniref:aromatic ring-hydroxylating oxygenase subunit alpha n=1 Tax=unclassified Sulfitobacter TaxID=196795 RepID=UPI0023E25143|nr:MULTISPECIES: aromatic ring-hydroxylating dioxygenase subunit alpha [unclassified Sulfitobacter]MDF3413540.1 aromatic ring-hydroxylating dioxygenase subunit alpha [Sulfitobacter sp. KE5]MDF3421178.1 aromatic ring-hydroxylating dioxygenase subunit alpha [Sulfitobacter sp. KE43]MDF3432087.1 aromatic ring-hydroxylating dioxygenase subunit alpha [Sulfitobacter sp. KE42]MDF3457727.1 aromatic ring-hydroxylating dioxygenase subunit alpha [Sulfitobacter sp. S74]MDF3461628.1 aromatic ring-hydroxylat